MTLVTRLYGITILAPPLAGVFLTWLLWGRRYQGAGSRSRGDDGVTLDLMCVYWRALKPDRRSTCPGSSDDASRLPSLSLLTSLDFSQLSDRDSIVVAVHGFLGADGRLKAENPASAKRQFQFDALLQNAIEITDAEHFTKAIHNPKVRFQIELAKRNASSLARIRSHGVLAKLSASNGMSIVLSAASLSPKPRALP